MARNSATPLNILSDGKNEVSRNHEQIESNNGHALFAIIENGGSHFAGIVKRLVKNFSVTPWHFHADFWSDVALRKSSFENGVGKIGKK